MLSDPCLIDGSRSVERIAVIPGDSILALRNRQARQLHAQGGGPLQCGPHRYAIRWSSGLQVTSATADASQVQALRALLQRRFRALRAERLHWNDNSDPSINLNCRVPFADGSGRPIRCIHLALYWMQLFFDSHPFAPDYGTLRSAKQLQASIPVEVARFWHSNALTLGRLSAVKMEDWGRYFVERLADLERKGEEATTVLVLTADHAMAVGLRVERRSFRSLYHVCFYEPNHTAAHVQAFFDDFTGIAALQARDFTEAALDHWPADPRMASIRRVDAMMMVEVDATAFARLHGCRRLLPVQPRTLVGPLPDPSADAMFNLLRYGLDNALRALLPILGRLPDEERVRRLSSQGPRPPFHNVMEFGLPSTVALFGELIEGLPLEQRVRLLQGMDQQGRPAFHTAIRSQRVGVFKAFVNLVRRLLPADYHFSSLNAAGPDGESALFAAFEQGHIATVGAFAEAISGLPPLQRASLLAARSAQGESGLEAAVRTRRPSMIAVWMEPVQSLPKAARAYLLRPAWQLALDLGQQDADSMRCRDLLHQEVSRCAPELLALSRRRTQEPVLVNAAPFTHQNGRQ